jgi:hypothetical protein
MMKGRSWNIHSMESIKTPWTQELKRNIRKNMKIPRKKERQNNQSLYRESQDYQPDMNSLKEIKQRN